ncbi:MAG: hypothetical protein U0Q18_35985 [Bryobacteraceae bacterium]
MARIKDSAEVKTVVVFDIGSVDPQQQDCFIQQAKVLSRRLGTMPNVSSFVVSYEWTEFHRPFNPGSGQIYEYFLPEPHPKEQCTPGPWPDHYFWWDFGWAGQAPSRQSFRGLAEALQMQHGPVRVLWLGQFYGWLRAPYAYDLDTYTEVIEGRSQWEPSYTPNAAYDWLDAVTAAGISYWPMFWLHGRSEQAKGSRLNLKDASELARYLGGEAAFCSSDLTACFDDFVARSDRGWAVTVSGPPVDWPVNPAVKHLRIWYEPDPNLLDVKRPYVRLAKPLVKSSAILAWRTRIPATPFFDATWLPTKPDCRTPGTAAAQKHAIAALVPVASLDGLQSYVEVLNVSPQTANRKLTREQERGAILGEHMQLHARNAPTFLWAVNKETAAVCVDLPQIAPSTGAYRVIVFNPANGWAGVSVVPASEVTGSDSGE